MSEVVVETPICAEQTAVLQDEYTVHQATTIPTDDQTVDEAIAGPDDVPVYSQDQEVLGNEPLNTLTAAQLKDVHLLPGPELPRLLPDPPCLKLPPDKVVNILQVYLPLAYTRFTLYLTAFYGALILLLTINHGNDLCSP